MDIRPAAPDDLEALARVDSLLKTDPTRLAGVAHAIVDQHVLAAVDDHDLVGYLILTHTFFGNGFVDLLVVAPEKRRAGIGTTLMCHARTLCRTPKLFTSTNASNTPMQALLERLGYTRCGTIDGLDEGDPEWVYVSL